MKGRERKNYGGRDSAFNDQCSYKKRNLCEYPSTWLLFTQRVEKSYFRIFLLLFSSLKARVKMILASAWAYVVHRFDDRWRVRAWLIVDGLYLCVDSPRSRRTDWLWPPKILEKKRCLEHNGLTTWKCKFSCDHGSRAWLVFPMEKNSHPYADWLTEHYCLSKWIWSALYFQVRFQLQGHLKET